MAKPTEKYALTTLLAVLVAIGSVDARRAHADVCGGDCNFDGQVIVNELVTGVNIALGAGQVASCAAMDTNNGLDITVDELVGAVNHALAGCPATTCTAAAGGRCVTIAPGPNAQDDLLSALVEAQPNDVIFLQEGRYEIDGQLSLQVDNVTIRGQGMNRSVLSFRNQSAGAEGLLVQANHFTLEDVGLEDGPGDLFKALGGDGITVRGVRAEWTDGPKTSNGSYGLYPVQCRDVLIQHSFVRGASDAGIYVGQSRNIIVRGNRVEENVAGIEIENSTDADVSANVSTKNTGGVLVFNLPGPQVQGGRRTRIFANQIVDNNTENFAPSGNIVHSVPTGTGAMVLANDQVEIFNNAFRNNDSTHIILISYNTARLFGASAANNPDFDPYSETVFVHDNSYEGGGAHPPSPDLDPIVQLNGGLPLPNILFDGDANRSEIVDGMLPDALRTCVQESNATILNLNFAFGTPVSHDLAQVDCTHEPLAQVTIGSGRHIEIAPGAGAEDALLQALLDARPGDDILVKAGTYDFTQALSLTVDHVTLRGEGMDQTVLRFAGLAMAGEGLLVQNVSDFTLRDLAIVDSPGDQFKAVGVDGLRVQRVRTEWTAGPQPTNGAYGIYPVQCKDVLVEESVARGASDTGIYVGQSRNIIVRRNTAEENVSGVEIDNCIGADAYDNTIRNNAGGILVFNVDTGLQINGERARVYDNQIVGNNLTAFNPDGHIISVAPTGTGLLVMADDKVEAFGNTFQDNNTFQVLVMSYRTAQRVSGAPAPTNGAYDPYAESIYLHDNTYTGGGAMPPANLQYVVDIIGQGLPLPQIAFDGDVDAAKLVNGTLPAALRTCIQESGATFVNLNVPTWQTTPDVSHDLTPFNCMLEPLTPIAIAGVQ